MAEATSPNATYQKTPISVLFLGMAGSGKTSLVKALAAHLLKNKISQYLINLDPAVREVPFPANIGRLILVFFSKMARYLRANGRYNSLYPGV